MSYRSDVDNEVVYAVFWRRIHDEPLPELGPGNATSYPSPKSATNASIDDLRYTLHVDAIQGANLDRLNGDYALPNWERDEILRLTLPTDRSLDDGERTADSERWGAFRETYRDRLREYADDLVVVLNDTPIVNDDGIDRHELNRFSKESVTCRHGSFHDVDTSTIAGFKIELSEVLQISSVDNVVYCGRCDDYFDLGKPPSARINNTAVRVDESR